MKVLNMQGEDITPKPPTPEEEFMEYLINLIQTVPVEIVEQNLFAKYNITKK